MLLQPQQLFLVQQGAGYLVDRGLLVHQTDLKGLDPVCQLIIGHGGCLQFCGYGSRTLPGLFQCIVDRVGACQHHAHAPLAAAGLTDSKALTARRRAQLVPLIERQAEAWALGQASAREIDQFGIRTANYPLTEEDFEHNDLPKSLQGLETRIFGLSIQPERLHQIRSERRPDSDYSALRQCYFEVHWAERMFQAMRIPFVHTTVLSIEELAVTIINRMGLQRRVF